MQLLESFRVLLTSTRGIARYLVFTIGIFCCVNGCHVTGPADSGKNSPQDSTKNSRDTIFFAQKYEPGASFNFINIRVISHNYYARDNNVEHDSYDTALTSSTALNSFSGFFLGNSRIIKNKIFIESDNSTNTGWSYRTFSLSNAPFIYGADSSIHIVLDGTGAEEYINFSFFYHDSQLHYGGNNGTYVETREESHDFYQRTDSTHIEITLFRK